MRTRTIGILATTSVAWIAQTGVALADNCGSPSDCFFSQRAAILALIAIATIAAFVVGGPGAAFATFFIASDVATAATGRDPLTWEKTPRWVGALGLIDPTPGNVGARGGTRLAREVAEEFAEDGGERTLREGAEAFGDEGAERAAVEVRVGAGESGPWAEGVQARQGGAVAQATEGSCVSACGDMLADGSILQAQLLSELGEWSNPGALADALNSRVGSQVWRGGYFEGPADALAAANRGRMAAVLQSPGGPAHMVVIEPLGAETYLVRDPLPGVNYEVGADWIKRFVSGGVFQ